MLCSCWALLTAYHGSLGCIQQTDTETVAEQNRGQNFLPKIGVDAVLLLRAARQRATCFCGVHERYTKWDCVIAHVGNFILTFLPPEVQYVIGTFSKSCSCINTQVCLCTYWHLYWLVGYLCCWCVHDKCHHRPSTAEWPGRRGWTRQALQPDRWGAPALLCTELHRCLGWST